MLSASLDGARSLSLSLYESLACAVRARALMVKERNARWPRKNAPGTLFQFVPTRESVREVGKFGGGGGGCAVVRSCSTAAIFCSVLFLEPPGRRRRKNIFATYMSV